MPVTVDSKISQIVKLIGDTPTLLVKSVVLIAGDDADFPMEERSQGEHLPAASALHRGDRVACRLDPQYFDIVFDGTEVMAEPLDPAQLRMADKAWIDDGRPRLDVAPPPTHSKEDALSLTGEAGEQALSDMGATGEDPAGIKARLEDFEQQAKILDALPLGYEYLFFMHELIQDSLDLAEQENEMVVDALTMAIDQVQDMRITWLEKPPQSSWTEVLIVAVLIVSLEMGVAALATQLIFRAIRISQRIKIGEAIKHGEAAKERSVTLLQNLKLKHQAAVQRARDKYVAAKAQRDVTTRFQERYVADRLIKQRGDEMFKASERSPEEAKLVATLQEEIEHVKEELKRLSGDLRVTDAVQSLGKDSRFDSLIDPYLKNLSPSVSSAISKYAKEAAKGGSSLNTGREEKPPTAVPVGGEAKNAADVIPGDTPSTILRSQALRWRRTQKLQIAQMRRKIDILYHQALMEPDVLEIVLRGMRETMAAVVLPEAAKLDYARAIRDLALKFELQIWALVLGQIKLTKTNPGDFLLERKNYRDHLNRFLVKGVDKDVVRYLLKRFGRLGVYEGEEIVRIAEEMTKVRQDIFKTSEDILEKYSIKKNNRGTEELGEPGELKLRYEAVNTQ